MQTIANLMPLFCMAAAVYFFFKWVVRDMNKWALSSNGTENTHKLAYRSSIPAVRGSRSGLSSPRAMISGSVKA